MGDTLSVQQRSERMSLIAGKHSKPEMAVRRLVHRLGFRFRLHRADLPGTPDLVFSGQRKAVFVHGCFWHRHPDPNCRLARMPKSRQEFWGPKLTRNRERDLLNQAALESLGWSYLVLWECELKDSIALENRIRTFLG